jgi:hypothetical protein
MVCYDKIISYEGAVKMDSSFILIQAVIQTGVRRQVAYYLNIGIGLGLNYKVPLLKAFGF